MSEATIIQKSETELKQEELEFGIDEAVEVLMAKYSSNVQAEVDVRKDARDEIESEYDAAVERVKGSVDTAQYNTTSEVLGIRSRVSDVTVQLGKTVEDSSIRVVLMLTDLDIVGQNYTPEFGKYRKLELNGEDYETLTAMNKRLEEANESVSEMRNKLYNTATVERQVRAKVMEVRLKEMGMSDLLDNEEVNALISV